MKWLVAFLACIGIAQAQIVQHNISDDGYAHIPLQFPFPLYGRIFTDSYMYSNGVVGFGSVNNHWCCSGYDLANARGYQFNYSILGLQTDLINYGQGRFLTEGTPQYQRYKWENISEYGRPNNLNTFGIEIRPSGFIGIYYEKVNLDRPYTTGITGDTTLGELQNITYGSGLRTNTPFSHEIGATGNLCLIDPLSSPSCPNYQQAYLTQQCTINALYSPSCAGYEQAYFNQQCSLNPLYDRTCSGYNEAYALQNVVQTTQAPTITTVQVSTTGAISVTAPIVADPVVNEVITRTPTNTPNNTQNATNTQSNPIQSNASESKSEKKPEPKQAPKQTATAKGEIPTQVIPQPIHEYKAPIILDLAYQRMVKKPITDNNRAMYNLIMNSQIKHEEMVDGQYRKGN
jgi:hypothetical protein